jgi:hypothetical protein
MPRHLVAAPATTPHCQAGVAPRWRQRFRFLAKPSPATLFRERWNNQPENTSQEEVTRISAVCVAWLRPQSHMKHLTLRRLGSRYRRAPSLDTRSPRRRH